MEDFEILPRLVCNHDESWIFYVEKMTTKLRPNIYQQLFRCSSLRNCQHRAKLLIFLVLGDETLRKILL
ncbi:hypothetical protein ACN38_g6078 [Penicillium nordicum]|uniref:Uncharacterized protein n=1 Tax=Penicillium nordicum TaxID=229535 RepID=A0A0M9WFL7_9EURO|nr:hypothetical protein ACN38_g6078 [Penicillium nordicum]